MAYTPPPGSSLTFEFGGSAYTPPAGDSLSLVFTDAGNAAYPSGFSAFAAGTPTIYNTAQAVVVDGFDASEFGAPTIISPQYIAATGIDPGFVGGPTVSRPPYQELLPTGYSATLYGDATVYLGQQWIYPTGYSAALYGTPSIRNQREFLRPTGYDASRFGTQNVENFNRYLTPGGFVATGFGSASVTYRNRTISASGSSLLAMGTPRAGRSPEYILPPGYANTSFGALSIFNYDPTQRITVPGNDVGLIAADVVVYNLRQIIQPESLGDTSGFGSFNYVENYDREVRPSGFSLTRIGTPSLEEVNYTRTLRPSSILEGGYGTATVYQPTRYLLAEGFDSALISRFAEVYINDRTLRPPGIGPNEVSFGTPTIILAQQYLVAFGQDMALYGSPEVTLGERTISVPSLLASAFGVADVSHELRYITGASAGTGAVGSPEIQLRLRYLDAVGTTFTVFGRPLMGFNRTLYAAGFDASDFGRPDVDDNSQAIDLFTRGLDAGGIGLPTVDLYTRKIAQGTTPIDSVFGTLTRVYNSDQYVAPYTDTPLTWGPYFGSFNLIENANRTIGATGFNASKVSIAAVLELKARLIEPAGFDAFSTGPGTFVAPATRYLGAEGIDSLTTTRWAVVYNGARVVAPAGFNAAAYGTAELLNLNRTVRQFFPYEGESFGTAFAAYRIREITFFQGIPEPPVGLLTIYNGNQYLRPVGFKWQDETGGHSVIEHFSIIAPRWNYTDRLGNPEVRNLTPELRIYGHDSAEFGQGAIRTQYRFVTNAGGTNTVLFGNLTIKDRRQTVEVQGLRAGAIERFTRVALAQPELPFPQTLEPVGFPVEFNPAMPAFMGRPSVRTNVLYPEGLAATRFGTAAVLYYGIQPPSIIPTPNFASQFGIPSLNPTQFANAFGIVPPMPSRTDNDGDQGGTDNRHRIDPYTIYCRFDVTSQALANNGGARWRYMDQRRDDDDGARPFFGATAVSLFNREMRATGRDFAAFGLPTLALRRIVVQPAGFRPQRFGFPEFFGGLRLFQFYGFDMAVYGEPSVDHYIDPGIPRYLRPTGLLAYATGASNVENQHRQVFPTGYDAARVSNTAAIGPPVFPAPAGIASQAFGTATVSNYIRYLEPVGTDMLDADYTIGDFTLRMRVYHRDFVRPGMGVLTGFGTASVGNGTRYIRQTDEIARGGLGVPACSTRNIVALGGLGIDAGEFGDVDRWEAGKIKPHGDEMLACGAPRMASTINALSIVGGVGQPSIGRFVSPAAFDSSEFESPAVSLTDPHGCGSFGRAVVPSQIYGTTFGLPMVN